MSTWKRCGGVVVADSATKELTPEQKEFLRLAYEFIEENHDLLIRLRDS
jgi:hypothetical protein